MADIFVGTAGWDYKDWIGPFYPKKLERNQHLEYYAKFFNLVEINSTFYNLPPEVFIRNWASKVPESFKFIVKCWQKITHYSKDIDIDASIDQFFHRINPLKDRISRILLQFPPWFHYSEKHHDYLTRLLKIIPKEYDYVIELRDNSWFNSKNLSNIINGTNVILGTTYMPGIKAFYKSNQEYYYIRLIGDRILTVFNRIQRTQDDSISDLKKNVLKLQNFQNVKQIFIIVNNHFAGFAPQMAIIIKDMFQIPYKQFNRQKSLTDFI